MKRTDIEKDYFVDDEGVIRTPGKFETEMVYVPYFWDMILNGVEDRYYFNENNVPVSEFVITEDDIREFPELDGVHIVSLWEDFEGFVWCEVIE